MVCAALLKHPALAHTCSCAEGILLALAGLGLAGLGLWSKAARACLLRVGDCTKSLSMAATCSASPMHRAPHAAAGCLAKAGG